MLRDHPRCFIDGVRATPCRDEAGDEAVMNWSKDNVILLINAYLMMVRRDAHLIPFHLIIQDTIILIPNIFLVYVYHDISEG